MNKEVLFIMVLALWCPLALAQVHDQFEVGDACSYFGESVPNRVATFSSDNEAEKVIRDIVNASGLAQNFKIMAAGVPNAAAVVRGAERFILYNQYFIQNMKELADNSWAPISIMAHEVGHHLNGHTLDNRGSRPKIELEADYYSGFILQRMGADLNDARAAMFKIGNDSGSATHPAKHDRLAAITNGWMKACDSDSGCKGQSSGKNDRAGTSTPKQKPIPTSVKLGFPSGQLMQPCGCWGAWPQHQVIEPRCENNYVVLRMCQNFCFGGGNAYAYVCL